MRFAKMRYAPAHKAQTREKVVALAAGHLRARGPDGIAIAQVMRDAGLTHGGFYAHFRSREDLVIAALELGFEQSQARMEKMLAGLAPREALIRFIDFYVSESHRDNKEQGCIMAALVSGLFHRPRKLRIAFEKGLQRRAAQFAKLMRAAEIEDADDIAAPMLAAMAGCVAMSRTVLDREFSQRLLAFTREGMKARLGLLAWNPAGRL